ncbi:gamma-glutamyl-gamma-aminobutyrate hydrolase family protein [Nocardioides caldifontis]|uniref:gamma-glutamyl-gamma-aminobutyrate hydrolase family protein n=1 Tax=Nocardioides caldifontis TaxID=2588938 RepID=UPI0011DFE686|nr:gamma-glutamyl-gamma-aminobutyrate hydrolase family protein [Nocardioides caldifontis]
MNADAPVVRRDEVEATPPGGTPGGTSVAVLVSLNFPDLTPPVADLVRRFTGCALQTLADLGASYELFDTSSPLADPTAVTAHDRLLVLGGGDVSATCWGGSDDDVPNSYGVDRRADDDSIAAIRAAADAGVPVLAICRGAQLLNVTYGGTIVPDITDYVLHRGGPGEAMFLDEKVSLTPGTRLHDLFGTTRLTVRSGHHQAVDRVAEGFRVAAVADDGVVEAIEHPSKWLVGVQWHPEDDDGPEADRLRLFEAFLSGDPGRTD